MRISQSLLKREFPLPRVLSMREDQRYNNKNMIYIIGGHEHPLYAAVTCSKKKCKKIIHLEISKQFKKRWSIKKETNGALSITPSVHVVDSPFRCHYWIKNDHVIWHSLPSLFVPKSNRIF